MMPAETGDKLTKRNLWAYTSAAIGRDSATYLWSGFLIIYVLYTKSLDNAQFAVLNMIMIATQVFDAFVDPIMGNILEVTRTRWGKFKPWIAIGMLLSAVIYLIMFSSRQDGWDFVVLFGALFFSYSIVFTFNDIAYWGMIPSLASRKQDRDRLTSQTVLFAGVGSGIAVLLVPPLTAGEYALGGSAVTAYARLALIFSALFIGAQMIPIIGVKEKPLPPKGTSTVNKVGIGTIYKTIRGNDQLSWCIVIFLFSTIASGILNGGLGMNYIFFEFGYNGLLFTIFSTLGALASGVVMLFYTPISKRFSRNQLIRFATLSIVGGYAFLLLVGLAVPSSAGMFKFALMMLGNLFAFGGQGVYYLVIMICIANTVEYNEWKTGARAEGIIFSVRPFITKLGWAVIQLIVMAVFMLSGVRVYTNQIADLENAAHMGLDAATRIDRINEVLAQVAPGRSMALLACMTIIPSVLALISYVLYKRKYTITEEFYDQILIELKERKAIAEAAQ